MQLFLPSIPEAWLPVSRRVQGSSRNKNDHNGGISRSSRVSINSLYSGDTVLKLIEKYLRCTSDKHLDRPCFDQPRQCHKEDTDKDHNGHNSKYESVQHIANNDRQH